MMMRTITIVPPTVSDDSDSDLDAPFTREDYDLCTQTIEADSRLTPRKRGYDTQIIA
jgi:hypothetical protein